MVLLLLLLLRWAELCTSADNDMARLPPMGWTSWMQFHCSVDCSGKHNDTCISSNLYESMADHLAADGYLEVGYNHINIDDCWNTFERNKTTNQQMANATRFPDGIAGLADYIHAKGLKLGLYNCVGSESCAKYTAIDGNYELDANTFASWNIDMIKIDGCHDNATEYYLQYPRFGQALNKTGRHILYACSWPAYTTGNGEANPPIDNTTLYEVSQTCNTWRNHHVPNPVTSWERINRMMQFCRRNYSEYNSSEFLNVAAPGGWNDPDQIMVGITVQGEYNLTIDQEKTQFAIWAIMAAPLIMSNDLRTIRNESREILLNKEIIDINQDPLGKQGGYIWMNDDETNVIWIRELHDSPTAVAIAMQNINNLTKAEIMFRADYVPSFIKGWNDTSKFKVRDLWTHTDLGIYQVNFSQVIPQTGVGMYKLNLV